MTVAVAPGIGWRTTELLDVLSRTADGMIAIDPEMRIIAWNDGATRLLGYRAEEALGRSCFEALSWLDRYGNPVCLPGCAECLRTWRDELVETTEVVARSSSGKNVWLTVSTVVPPPEIRQECQMVHLIREVTLHPQLERLLVERLGDRDGHENGVHAPLSKLTLREREIAGLLADGMDTREIAEKLVVSAATVRNHVQHILAKLECHSRVELVTLVLKQQP